MKVMNQPQNHKYNCLFLPGLPGRVKQFDFFKDVTNTGGKIHWLQYSGTYDTQDGTDFTLTSSVTDITNALDKLSKQKLPILVVAYSYSTVLLDTIDFSKYPSIFGMTLFSPIRGLDMESINEDFCETIAQLIDTRDITASQTKWSQDLTQQTTSLYGRVLEKLCSYDFPVILAYSSQDATIKADEVSKAIADFRQESAYNKILVFEQPDGHHKLDSYYDVKIGNFFRALEIELDLMKILDNDIFIYFWGSSLNYNYSGQGSDIDLLIFFDGYIDKYKELNNYVEKYNKTHEITFDLSINNKSDIMSKKIFRYNRGPVAIHELQYAYFPFKRATAMIDLAWDDVTQDAYSASMILSGESKKILSKCDVTSERVKKIVKYSITVFTYLQYVKGDKNLDLNHVERYLSRSDPFYENIRRSLELKKSNYEGMTLDDLFEAVRGIDMIVTEQERVLGKDS